MTTTTTRPIPVILQAPEVLALRRDGRARLVREVRPQPDSNLNPVWIKDHKCWQWATVASRRRCPFGEPGQRLWGKETWALLRPGWTDPDTRSVEDFDEWKGPLPDALPSGWFVAYRADGDWESHVDDRGFRWRPSAICPRWASRFLDIVNAAVSLERAGEAWAWAVEIVSEQQGEHHE